MAARCRGCVREWVARAGVVPQGVGEGFDAIAAAAAAAAAVFWLPEMYENI
jgi:hypothetical protein